MSEETDQTWLDERRSVIRKFPANPESPLVAAPVGGQQGHAGTLRSEFRIRRDDPDLGLTVVIKEQHNGHLVADVFVADSTLLDRASVSIGLIGTVKDGLICKTVRLNVPEEGGCSGSADFGPLADVVVELGDELGVIPFLILEPALG